MEELRGRSMSVRMVGDVLLVVHAKTDIDPGEWRTFCTLAGKARKARGSLRTLVISEGGAAPNAAQRAFYKEEVGSTDNRVAVLTDSVAARTVLTAMSWFNSEMKPFAPTDVPGALRYLEVRETTALRDAIAELRVELGLDARR